MKTPPEWYVWIKGWYTKYTILIKVSDDTCTTWALDGNSGFYIEDTKRMGLWKDAWRNSKLPRTSFTKISENEALKILIGGSSYGKSKYEYVDPVGSDPEED
jgi:hypothetical protein